jgi:hypothetical protein
MEDFTIEMPMDFITGKAMTTGCTWMKDICRKLNMTDMRMKSGEAREEIMQAETTDSNAMAKTATNMCPLCSYEYMWEGKFITYIHRNIERHIAIKICDRH